MIMNKNCYLYAPNVQDVDFSKCDGCWQGPHMIFLLNK